MHAAHTFSAEALLQHEPFVRALVRGLLADESRVQDIVQETWLTAITRPPARGSSLRAWLGTVASNLVRDSHRRRARRQMREQEASREEALESVDESYQRMAAQRDVVDVVLALEEPYRSVLVLRYFQDLSNDEIGQRLGRSAATVSSQISRAHELARKALDKKYGEDREAWSVPLLPLLARRVESVGSVPLLGGLVAATVLAASVGGWLLFVGQDAEQVSDNERATVALLDPELSGPDTESSPVAEERVETRRIVVPITPPSTAPLPAEDPALTGRLFYGDQLLPAERIQALHHFSIHGELGSGRTLLTTDEQGRFTYRGELLSAQTVRRSLTFYLSTMGPGSTSLQIEVDVPEGPLPDVVDLGDLIVPVPPFLVSGFVTDAGGTPLPRARLQPRFENPEGGLGSSRFGSAATTDTQGAFTIYGAVEEGDTCSLSATCWGFQTKTVEFEPGQAAFALALTSSDELGHVKVIGRLLVDEFVDASKLRVWLVGQDPGQGSFGTFVRSEGTLGALEVPAGRYTLEVREAEAARPARVDETYPDPGGQVPGNLDALSPRGLKTRLHARDIDVPTTREGDAFDLGEVDLRALLQVVTLRCTDALGQGVSNAAIGRAFPVADLDLGGRRSPAPDWSRLDRVAVDEQGEVALLLPYGEAPDFEVRAEGFAAARVPVLSEDRTVVLQRMLPLRLELTLGAPLEDPTVVRLFFDPPERGVGGRPVRAVVDSEGVADLAAPAGGEQTLHLELFQDTPGVDYVISLVDRVVSVEPGDGQTVQRIALAISASELEAALARMELAKDRRR